MGAAIGKAIRVSIDAGIAQEVMDRHNRGRLLRTASGRLTVEFKRNNEEKELDWS